MAISNVGKIIPDKPSSTPKPTTSASKPSVQSAMAADKKATSAVVANKSASTAQYKANTSGYTGSGGTYSAPAPKPTTSTFEDVANFVLGESIVKAVKTGDISKVNPVEAGLLALSALPVVGPIAKGASVAAKGTKFFDTAADTAKAVTTPKGAPKYAVSPAPAPARKPSTPSPSTPSSPQPFSWPTTPKPKESPIKNPMGPTSPLTPKPSTPTTPRPAPKPEPKPAPKPEPKPVPAVPPKTAPKPGPKTAPKTAPKPSRVPGTLPKRGVDTKPTTETSPSTGRALEVSKRNQFAQGAQTAGSLARNTARAIGTKPSPSTQPQPQTMVPAPPGGRTTTRTTNQGGRNVPKTLPLLSSGSAWQGPVESNWQNFRG